MSTLSPSPTDHGARCRATYSRYTEWAAYSQGLCRYPDEKVKLTTFYFISSKLTTVYFISSNLQLITLFRQTYKCLLYFVKSCNVLPDFVKSCNFSLHFVKSCNFSLYFVRSSGRTQPPSCTFKFLNHHIILYHAGVTQITNRTLVSPNSTQHFCQIIAWPGTFQGQYHFFTRW